MDSTEPTTRTTAQAGTLSLTVWPDTPLGEHQRYAYRIEDTAGGHMLEGRDLFTGAGAPVAAERAMRDLAAFLSAAGDARRYAIDNPGSTPEHQGLFPDWTAEAARQNADALTLLAEEEQLSNPSQERSRPAPDPSWFERPPGVWVAGTRGRSL
ncbi:hypothetical protein [Actinotalea caeni]|uniref:hypothetical protein n=1 Tax=Actinotalea caeni TaxID=1348467 RepID=UPI0012E121B5|nr:hypothetical protein [Actinotalea caeni]